MKKKIANAVYCVACFMMLAPLRGDSGLTNGTATGTETLHRWKFESLVATGSVWTVATDYPRYVTWRLSDEQDGEVTFTTNITTQTITLTNLILEISYKGKTNSVFLKQVGASTNSLRMGKANKE